MSKKYVYAFYMVFMALFCASNAFAENVAKNTATNASVERFGTEKIKMGGTLQVDFPRNKQLGEKLLLASKCAGAAVAAILCGVWVKGNTGVGLKLFGAETARSLLSFALAGSALYAGLELTNYSFDSLRSIVSNTHE